jgi:hypothetical protein
MMVLEIWLGSAGVQQPVLRVYPKAVYVHCASHTLNLCVVAACEVQSIKNMMGTLVQICIFFSFPKRQLELEKQMKEMNFTDSTRKKLVSLCKTCWVARIESLDMCFMISFLCL